MEEYLKCAEFLALNGWFAASKTDEYFNYIKDDNHIGVDLSQKEFVFLGENGDFLHEKVNLYTLIGALIYHRQISAVFKQK